MQNLNQDKVKAYFKAYPKAKSLFFTSDNACFLMKNRAQLHANSKKLGWQEIQRSSVDLTESTKTKAPSKTPVGLTVAEAQEQLLTFELNEKCNWETIQAIGKALEVSANSKAEYIAALTPIKEELLNANKED